MKHVYVIVMILLVMPICLHAQTIAPRRPLALDSYYQSTRKSLLPLREKIKKAQTETVYTDELHNIDHEAHHTVQQKSSKPTIKAG